jgi:hypothetical protein
MIHTDPTAIATEARVHKVYQDASRLTTSEHSTSKWVIHALFEMKMRRKKDEPKPRLLEIGAINTQLIRCSWLDVMAIDILSKHPSIQQCDFFDLDKRLRFDVSDRYTFLSLENTVQSLETKLIPTHNLNMYFICS